MTRTKLFRSNRSQAVRLPKSLAFPDSVKDVSIVREGKRRVIVPSNAVWDDFFDSPASTFPYATNRPFRIANRSDAEVLAGHEPLHSCLARSHGFASREIQS
jgi:antitoxin VapB